MEHWTRVGYRRWERTDGEYVSTDTDNYSDKNGRVYKTLKYAIEQIDKDRPLKRREQPKPGNYGRIKLSAEPTTAGKMHVVIPEAHYGMTADEMREAAHTLNQWAEWLTSASGRGLGMQPKASTVTVEYMPATASELKQFIMSVINDYHNYR